MKKIFLFAMILGFSLKINAQGSLCGSATISCTGNSAFTFPADTSYPEVQGQVGPNYGCLITTPNPAWYFMQVTQSGDINIEMHTTPERDIDFICWGPFSDYTTPCTALLTGPATSPGSHYLHVGNVNVDPGPGGGYPAVNTIDCSFSAYYQEWCYIPNAIAGQYYILLITNYSNHSCNISFSQMTGTGATGCTSNANNNGPICEGDSLKLSANSMAPNAQYYWIGPNGWSSYLQNPKIPVTSMSNSGTYYLDVTIGNYNAPETQTVVVIKPKPNIIAPSDTICIGDTAIITASGASSYVWKPIGSTTNPTFTTNTIKLAATSNSTYKVIGTLQGCKDSINTSIKVNPQPLVSVNNPSICPKDTATLIANGAHTYVWNFGVISDSIRVSPTHDTTYVVVGTDINNCVDTATASVHLYPLPTIQLTPNTTICLGSQATLTAGGGIAYSWNTNPPETTSSITVSPTANTTTYTVGVTDNNNCFDSASVEVNTLPLPLPTISIEMDTICKGTYTTITASGGNTYLWNTGEITPSISVKPLSSSIYSVTVSSTLNNVVCSKDTSIKQNVRNCNVIYVPNSFMPTGYNTVFKPIGDIAITKTYQFAIYNRWGQMVFETTDVNQGWDGRFNGEYVQTGAYIYYLKIDNGYEEPFEKIGTVTVVN
ncbi:MAG: gliding motility-associated C-terminal domain-containing protein [Bacteroidetes bacterium]|nr:gliding motility-associated C-terminal domain-containing protein [Bacteroidota bacterium]